jgi:hypothetical protein
MRCSLLRLAVHARGPCPDPTNAIQLKRLTYVKLNEFPLFKMKVPYFDVNQPTDSKGQRLVCRSSVDDNPALRPKETCFT